MSKFLVTVRQMVVPSVFSWQLKVNSVLKLNRSLSERVTDVQVSRRTFQPKEKKKLPHYAIYLLIVPVTSFGLGIWQIQRKKWKENLIENLNQRKKQKPVPLPENLEDLKNMEFVPVSVKGRYHHDKEMYIGPRSLIIDGGMGNVASGLISKNKPGYLVVTPFELSESGKTILVNRGWISPEELKTRKRNEPHGEVELTGIVRLHEERPKFGVKSSGNNLFHFRDVNTMAEIAGAEPIYIDADVASSIPGGPIGGQTRISLRNEHLSYILTWFGISITSAFFWYLKFIHL